MAGERKGITYEAILKIALEELVRKGKLTGTVFWNEKPDAMTIEPDFTVGSSKDSPTHLFLVTHSGASGNSHMKFWRNMGELAEAKIRLRSVPHVTAISFDSVIKDDIKVLQDAAFDGHLVVGDRAYGSVLLPWIEQLSGTLPKNADEKAEALLREAGTRRPVAAAIAQFTTDLAACIANRRGDLVPLWDLARRRRPPAPRDARNTSFKKGIAKLLVANEPRNLLASIARGKPVPKDWLLEDLGWVNASISGNRITDPDLLFIGRVTPAADVEVLISSLSEKKSLADMLRPLRDAEAFLAVARHLSMNWARVRDAEWLYREMVSAHQDAIAFSRKLGAVDVRYARPGIVAEALVELLKAASGKRQGFGLARIVALLEAQVSRQSDMESAAKRLKLSPVAWRRANTVSYGYRDWLFGDDRTNFTLSSFELFRVADALSKASADVTAQEVAGGLVGLRKFWVSNLFEAKFACHRDLDVLDQIVAAALERSGLAFERISFFPAVWAEIATSRGAHLNVRSGSSAVFRVRDTVIVSKSATDEGRDHKKKELCGRAVAHRVELATNGEFGPRAGTKKMILVVDGSWESSDLAALSQAGWDEIFYPDEMDKLVKAIV